MAAFHLTIWANPARVVWKFLLLLPDDEALHPGVARVGEAGIRTEGDVAEGRTPVRIGQIGTPDPVTGESRRARATLGAVAEVVALRPRKARVGLAPEKDDVSTVRFGCQKVGRILNEPYESRTPCQKNRNTV